MMALLLEIGGYNSDWNQGAAQLSVWLAYLSPRAQGSGGPLVACHPELILSNNFYKRKYLMV